MEIVRISLKLILKISKMDVYGRMWLGLLVLVKNKIMLNNYDSIFKLYY